MKTWCLLVLAACAGAPENPGTTEQTVVGRCAYVNSFSDSDECKEYTGSAWTLELAAEDCANPMPGADPGSFEAEVACSRESILGECIVDEGGEDASTLVFPGVAGDSCDGLGIGCGFAGGEFVPSDLCEGETGVSPSSSVFRPFEQVCVDPLPGEPLGASEDDQVCTWEAISASTEEGRYFADYADCDVVRTQRPYFPVTAEADTPANDARLSDPDWMAEYEWATSQVEASACVCCHTTAEAPNGEPSGWYLEAGPIWTDSLDDDGMAMIAGWIDSTAFGAFDAEDNNGFSRDQTGLPTTDPQRMLAFFEGELARRGLQEGDFAETTPFGGPLYDQLQYEPSACDDGQGVSRDGSINWSGGNARYIYVMDPAADAPGVPPNLDLPLGTHWRLDVAYDSDPLASGIRYGDVTEGASQRWPESGSAPALVSGEAYYLYVLADVYIPLTRCLFIAP